MAEGSGPADGLESVAALVRAALAAVDEEIEQWRWGRGTVGSEPQLKHIRHRLSEMLGHLAAGWLPPRENRAADLSRVIADSWPFGSALGEVIVEAERAYLATR